MGGVGGRSVRELQSPADLPPNPLKTRLLDLVFSVRRFFRKRELQAPAIDTLCTEYFGMWPVVFFRVLWVSFLDSRQSSSFGHCRLVSPSLVSFLS